MLRDAGPAITTKRCTDTAATRPETGHAPVAPRRGSAEASVMGMRTSIVAPIAGSAGLPRARRRTALTVMLGTAASTASAQDIEPRAFANTPVGVNFLIGGYVLARGSLSFDPAAPALTLEEFTTWQQDLILGASVQVSVPVGQCDSTRAVNLGTNWWFVKPEIGASQRFGPLTLEATAAVTFFSDNGELPARPDTISGTTLCVPGPRHLQLRQRHLGVGRRDLFHRRAHLDRRRGE